MKFKVMPHVLGYVDESYGSLVEVEAEGTTFSITLVGHDLGALGRGTDTGLRTLEQCAQVVADYLSKREFPV